MSRLIIVALLVVLVGCGALAILVRSAVDTAVGDALSGGAASGQRVTKVARTGRTESDGLERSIYQAADGAPATAAAGAARKDGE